MGYAATVFQSHGGCLPVEIVASRVVFSLILCAALLPILKLTGGFVEVLRNRRATLVLFAASLLIGVNWFIYVLATTTGRTIDASWGISLTRWCR